MAVRFKNKKLAKYAYDVETSKRDWGLVRAKLFHLRLNHLVNAGSVEELRYLPGRYHELAGDRRGQWSCDLDQPYRLIFELSDHGGVCTALVIEIVDHH